MSPRSKNIVITGAAGGIGREAARLFLGEGHHVIALDINTSGLGELTGHPNLIPVEIDVADATEVRAFIDSLPYTAVDVLVAGAGIYESWPVSEVNPARFRKIIEVNLLSAQILVSSLLGHLIRAKGRIMIISSESVKLPALFQPYMVSKIGLEAFAVTARQELALKNVKLIIIRPGAVNTGLLRWMEGNGELGYPSVFDREFRKSFSNSLRLVGRPARPEDVARVIFRASMKRKPGRVYRINNNPVLRLLSLLPASLVETIIKRKFRDP